MADYLPPDLPPIVFNIDIDHITKGIQGISLMDNAIERGIDLGIIDLGNRLKNKMIDFLTEYGLNGTQLAQSIYTVEYTDGIEISVGADYGVYVEYGTGIVGSNNPHPSPEIMWEYDVNKHGNKGWVYKDEDGQFRRTKGQGSRPFLYKTALYGNRIATRIIRSHIRKEMAKVAKEWGS